MIFGYMRISTKKDTQTTERQRHTLNRYAKDNNFKFDVLVEETISGKVKANDRPVYKQLKKTMIANGNNPPEPKILIVTDIDRLGRDADDIMLEIKSLKANGIKVIALDIPYLSDWSNVGNDSIFNMITDITITIKAHMAQQEREKISERVKEGMAAAKLRYALQKDEDEEKRQKKIGRPYAFTTGEYAKFVKKYEKYLRGDYGKLSKKELAGALNIGRTTLYKYINFFEEEKSRQKAKAEGKEYEPKPTLLEELQQLYYK